MCERDVEMMMMMTKLRKYTNQICSHTGWDGGFFLVNFKFKVVKMTFNRIKFGLRFVFTRLV